MFRPQQKSLEVKLFDLANDVVAPDKRGASRSTRRGYQTNATVRAASDVAA